MNDGSTINRRLLAALLLLAAGTATPAAETLAAGAGTPAKDTPRTVELYLHPAREPDPALSVSLSPGFLERKPGNAAQFYYRALLLLPGNLPEDFWGKVDKWLDTKGADLPRDEVNQALTQAQSALRETGTAARHDHCQWDEPIDEGFGMLLPSLAKYRSLARLLALQAHWQIAEHQLPQALDTFQIDFSLGHHVGQGPTLIEGLVGAAIGRQALREVEQFVQQPGAPNLYWALTALPRPYTALRQQIGLESHVLFLQFPALREVNRVQMSVSEARDLLQRIFSQIGTLNDEPALAYGSTALTLLLYPEAKQALIRAGEPAATVEALPTAQVVMRYQLQTYQQYGQQFYKWFYVPFDQAREPLRRLQQRMDRDFSTPHQRLTSALARMLLPALYRAYYRTSLLERDIALLRCVEALRLYAASHQGQLPQSLADITEAPVPRNPLTGAAFLYRHENGQAVLEAPVPPGEQPNDGLRYVIHIQN